MKKIFPFRFLLLFLFLSFGTLQAQTAVKAAPVFENGEAQIVPAFKEADKWIPEDL